MWPHWPSVLQGNQGHYREGIKVVINVSFNEQVTIAGTPSITLSIGGTSTASASYEGSGGTAFSHDFSYTVGSGHNGDVQVTGFTVDASNSIKDQATTPNSVAATLSPALDVSGGVKIDTTAPTVQGLADDTDPMPSKTWSWSCSEADCQYRL